MREGRGRPRGRTGRDAPCGAFAAETPYSRIGLSHSYWGPSHPSPPFVDKVNTTISLEFKGLGIKIGP